MTTQCKLLIIGLLNIILTLTGLAFCQEQVAFSSIFGPQNISKNIFTFINSANDFDISVVAIKGKDIIFDKSRNSIITLNDGQLTKSVEPKIIENRTYVFTKIKLKTRLGSRVYDCSVEITEGKLKGAIIHIRDNKFPDSITDAYQAYFLLPKELQIPEGKLNFKIVDFKSK